MDDIYVLGYLAVMVIINGLYWKACDWLIDDMTER